MSPKNSRGTYIFDSTYIENDNTEYSSKVCKKWIETFNHDSEQSLVYPQDINLPEKQCTRESSAKKRKSDVLPCVENFLKRPAKLRAKTKKLTQNVRLETVISVDDKINQSATKYSAFSLDLHVKSTKKTATRNTKEDKQKLEGSSPQQNFLGKSMPKTSTQKNIAVEQKLDKEFKIYQARRSPNFFPFFENQSTNKEQAIVGIDDSIFGISSHTGAKSTSNRHFKTHTFEFEPGGTNVPEIPKISKHALRKQKPNIEQPDAILLNTDNSSDPLTGVRHKNVSNPVQNKRIDHERPSAKASSINPCIVASAVQSLRGSLYQRHFKTQTFEFGSSGDNVPEILKIKKDTLCRRSQKSAIDKKDTSPLNTDHASLPDPITGIANPNESNSLQTKRITHERRRVNALPLSPSIVESTVQPPVHGSLVPVASGGDGRMVSNHFHNCRHMKIVYIR